MTKRLFFIPLALVFAFLPVAVHAETFTLDQVIARALERSEDLQRADQDIVAAKARYDQAFSALLPSVDLISQFSVRDDPTFGRLVRARVGGLDPATNPNGGSANIGRTQFDSGVTLSQPIFNGFRDLYFAEAVEDEIKSFEFGRERQRDLIAQQVSELFFQIISYQDDLAINAQSQRALSQRTNELKDFAQLGRAKESEVDAARADVAQLEAEGEVTKRLLAASREALAFFVVLPADSISLQRATEVGLPLKLDEYVARSAERSDIRSLQATVNQQQRLTKVAEREAWPSISADSTSLMYEDPDRNRDWELLFRLNVPIFDGGRIDANVREQQARARSAELLLQQRKRSAERDVRTAYAEYLLGRTELDKLAALIEATRRNYQAQRSDYSLGVVTNIEVLQALRQTQDAERRRSVAAQALNSKAVAVEIAAGGYFK